MPSFGKGLLVCDTPNLPGTFCFLQLDVLFGNLPEMLEFQVEFLKTLEDGTRLVPDLEKLERVDQFKVEHQHQ